MRSFILLALPLVLWSFRPVVSNHPAGVLGGYDIGSKAADFKLKNIDGKSVSLSDYSSAKGFIIIFSCNHCPFVKKTEGRMEELNKKFASQGYPVIAINSNDTKAYPEDSYENMKKRAKEKGFTFPYLFDETQAVAKAFGAEKTPHVFVLSKKGTDLIVEYIGAIDDNVDNPKEVKVKYVENAIEALKAGKKIEVTKTAAKGCGIKWKTVK
jgi:peroxiredoxin